MKLLAYRFIFSCPFLYTVFMSIRSYVTKGRDKIDIQNSGRARISKDIIGNNNRLIVGKASSVYDLKFKCRGNNNNLTIGGGVYIGPGCSFSELLKKLLLNKPSRPKSYR